MDTETHSEKKKKKPPLALTEYVSGFLIIKHKVEINIALY